MRTMKGSKKRKQRQKHSRPRDEDVENVYFARSNAETPVSSTRSPCSYRMDSRGMYDEADGESEPDRSHPAWKISPCVSPVEVAPVVEEKVEPTNIWDEIMFEYENEREQWLRMNAERKPYEPPVPVGARLTAVQYLEKHIFPILCPALEETLFQAKKEECLQIQKCVFNGLDRISEILWNKNPSHPRRMKRGYRNIFDIPFVKIWLYYHPRPIYPLSWVWTKEEAITVMQTYIRRYFVCREPDCNEMRKFWQIFKQEKKEEDHQRELEHAEEVHEIVTTVIDQMIAEAVYAAELKVHGCFCISKPCHCTCKCFKWCKCCKCYKPERIISGNFYVGDYVPFQDSF